MNTIKAVGLGKPEVIGKKSLFLPPEKATSKEQKSRLEIPPPTSTGERRVRMTLEITLKSLSIIQEWQSRYRLDTGHPLPKWKIISDALELYEKTRKGEGSEK
ncbi:MAG: hypothetical protein HS100_04425 [Anaerolineales bacterium]|nr:hypothetical protein [Anaerolineales bacterium]